MAEKSLEIDRQRRAYLDNTTKIDKDVARENKLRRQEEFARLQLEYNRLNLDKKIKKRAKHHELCSKVFDVLLDLTEACFHKQKESGDVRIDQSVWEDLLQRFVDGRAINDEKVFKMFEKHEDGAQLERALSVTTPLAT